MSRKFREHSARQILNKDARQGDKTAQWQCFSQFKRWRCARCNRPSTPILHLLREDFCIANDEDCSWRRQGPRWAWGRGSHLSRIGLQRSNPEPIGKICYLWHIDAFTLPINTREWSTRPFMNEHTNVQCPQKRCLKLQQKISTKMRNNYQYLFFVEANDYQYLSGLTSDWLAQGEHSTGSGQQLLTPRMRNKTDAAYY